MLILSRADVESLIDRDALRDAVARAMVELSAGRASMPPRSITHAEQGGFLGVMPAHLGDPGVLSTKLVSLFPRNTDRPTHQAVIVVFDRTNGSPLALMDGTAITAERTAAGSALATDLLARRDVRVLAVLGTGVQARSHLRAVDRVRSFEEVRVAGRDRGKANALAAELSGELGSEIRACRTFEEAIRGADVVCGTTHPHEPTIRRELLSPGTHVNSVGFDLEGREVDARTVADALVVVESRAAALADPGGSTDLLWPIRDGVITADHVHAEIGEIVAGTKSGRTTAEQITLYKSVGVAVQDAAAAAMVLKAARARGIGTEVRI